MAGARRLVLKCPRSACLYRAGYNQAMKQGTSLAIGIAVGVTLGLVTENLYIGTGVGIVLSMVLGYRGGNLKD